MDKPIRILVLCTGNSCRSQMLHGFLKQNPRFEVLSAGIKPKGIHPTAVEVMKEIGIDISNHRSHSIQEYQNREFDLVITVCDSAKEECPIFPNAQRLLHHSFPDPDQKPVDIQLFRKVRDQIYRFAIELEKELLLGRGH